MARRIKRSGWACRWAAVMAVAMLAACGGGDPDEPDKTVGPPACLANLKTCT